MRTNPLRRPLTRIAGVATVAGVSTLALVGVLPGTAGATSAPYVTKTGVTSTIANLQTGQAALFTAHVSAGKFGVPGGQVVFTVTGADASVVSCDAGNTVVLASGAATCAVGGGLLAASGPYTVQAAYTDTVDSNYLPSTGSHAQTVVMGGTTTVVTSSASPSVTGQAVSFNAVVAAKAPSSGTPSGTVTFTGVTCDGGSNVITLSGGQAQCQISGGLTAQKADYIVTGAYSGSPQYTASTGKAKQSVKPAATTVTVAPSAGSCTGDVCSIGQGVGISFVATAAASGAGGGSGTPSGTIVFSIAPPGSKTSFPCDGGTNAITLNGAGQATCTIAAGLPAVVYYQITATLNSPTYQSSTGTMFENAALWGTTMTESAPKGIGAGQSFDITATVAPVSGYAGSFVPTGFVNILVCGGNSNSGTGCQGAAVPVGPDGSATLTVGGGEFPGEYTYQAAYAGDSNFYGSSVKNKYFGVGLSPTQLSLSEPGGFYSVDGSAVAITATVATANGAAGSTLIGPPTGTVTFAITGPSGAVTCAGGNAIALAANPGQAEGSVTCFLPIGTLTNSAPPITSYTVAVNYSGDSNFGVSKASAVQTVVAPAV